MALKTRHRHHSNNDFYDDVEKIKSALLDATYNAKDRTSEMLSDSLDNVKERTSLIKGNVEKYITEQPFKTTGIALLAGLAIGYLMHK